MHCRLMTEEREVYSAKPMFSRMLPLRRDLKRRVISTLLLPPSRLSIDDATPDGRLLWNVLCCIELPVPTSILT